MFFSCSEQFKANLVECKDLVTLPVDWADKQSHHGLHTYAQTPSPLPLGLYNEE